MREVLVVNEEGENGFFFCANFLGFGFERQSHDAAD
jgi:hypothetical protein